MLLNAFVSLVNRRFAIRSVRFERSIYAVEMCSSFGKPWMCSFVAPRTGSRD